MAMKITAHVASFPGSCAAEEKRKLGTHCPHMYQVSLVNYFATVKFLFISCKAIQKTCTTCEILAVLKSETMSL